MKQIFTISFLLLLTFINATIINVPADQPTIQAGLDIAIEGDSVLVAAGTYYENITWPNINGIKLIGTSADDCIIDGNSVGMVINYEHWDTIHDSTTVIKNFTIQNGWWARGCGINLRSENQFLLENLIIKDNYLFAPYESEIFENDRYCIEGGAGIHLDNYSSPIMRNILICNNYSELDGGGMFLYEHSEPVMQNVTIVNNFSETEGGGIHCSYSSNPNLVNGILWNNYPQEIFTFNDSINISYTDILNSWYGVGNIDSDPLFVDVLNEDYHLTENSPCIDAGDPNSPLDPDGTIADMGAFYFDQLNAINEIKINKYYMSNYPNPFNPSTTISFSILEESNVELSIYNIKGQKIKKLEIRNVKLGINEIVWDGKDDNSKPVTSGIYLYLLKVEGKTIASRKCLLLK
ncbi:MAG: T9SS type A sorting domain-containing protein [Candidatus Cloacimonetes bacterium]|nr:T9SS type A sorting domain-containing protein [Candidatus Cloacimonadota bacterium]